MVFLHFHFEIMVDSHAVVRNNTGRTYVTPLLGFPGVRFCNIVLGYHNWEIDIDTNHQLIQSPPA